MRYVLEVTAVVHDPFGEPVRLGSARYYVEQAELTTASWPITGARAMMTGEPFRWWMPSVDGKPSGAVFIECTLTQDDPDRRVPMPDERDDPGDHPDELRPTPGTR